MAFLQGSRTGEAWSAPREEMVEDYDGPLSPRSGVTHGGDLLAPPATEGTFAVPPSSPASSSTFRHSPPPHHPFPNTTAAQKNARVSFKPWSTMAARSPVLVYNFTPWIELIPKVSVRANNRVREELEGSGTGPVHRM
ncbi:hypothetical protein PAXINDRAFT_156310 [Paxillus involutus ATCC 200175]|uniref:Uncharacterized protein n=1 Tax=Paxillus involutus ATCC 200175 TaxID=664439 RepID=A0A0C9U2W6_PAXIN|nr:hypothetical protein PAXINDRAFT_156310 [Paxillus involutus ATCC 200175]